jgi:hypothetical protein
VELQAEVGSATHITQDAFYELKMNIAWGMHKEAHLLNSVLEVGAGKCQILESTGKTPVEGRVMARAPMSG